MSCAQIQNKGCINVGANISLLLDVTMSKIMIFLLQACYFARKKKEFYIIICHGIFHFDYLPPGVLFVYIFRFEKKIHICFINEIDK